MNAPNAIPLALLGRVEDALRKDAYDRCVEKLQMGEKVGRLDLSDLFDADLEGMQTFELAKSKLWDILRSDYPDTPLLQEKYKLDLIQRYLDSKPDLVDDMMNELEAADAIC